MSAKADSKLELKLEQALKAAMKARAKAETAALRLLVAVIKNKQIELRRPLTETEITALLKTEAKKRREAQEIYTRAGREELAGKEAFELKLINSFLPVQVSAGVIAETVAGLKQSGQLPANFGEAMKLVMAKFQGGADGRLVAEAVKAAL